jgi:L-aminopeptidase/D-esterase-like protein
MAASLVLAWLTLTGSPMDGPDAQVTTHVGRTPEAAATRGLTEVEGIRVGHHTLAERPTGCTVILVEGDGVPGGVSQRGGAPGTAEVDLLNPLNLVDRVNAVVLTGGSAFGLDVRHGVVRYLEERHDRLARLHGRRADRPGGGADRSACGRASRRAPHGRLRLQRPRAQPRRPLVAEGNVGAGAGATVGKLGGGRSMKGGLGSAAIALPNGLVVGAIVAVNAVGDVIDPTTAQVVAGARTDDGKHLLDLRKALRTAMAPERPAAHPGENTTIALVATNARLTKAEVNRMALMADDGLARAINPSHTTADGDTVFALATGRWTGDTNLNQIGALAAEALAEAIVRAVSLADGLPGIPSARDLGTVPARLR